MSDITTIGLDLAKDVFQVHGVDARGIVRVKKRLIRKQVLEFFANLQPCLVGMEACGGAYHWARELKKLGHDVRLMNPQFVKPYVKSNKNDANDAEAICEAVGRTSMRFVEIKTVEQQYIQALHRIRERVMRDRTATVNQLRGLLGEYGIAVEKRVSSVRRRLPEILEDGENGLTSFAREMLNDVYEQLQALDERIKHYDQRIQAIHRTNEACQRLAQVEGIGPITATALIASVGDAKHYKNGRQMSAALGLVPRQHSSGGKDWLQGISKRGDSYLRKLLIHGARSVIKVAQCKDDARSQKINQLVNRRNKNIAAVAVANKNARIAWVLLARGETYRPETSI